MVSARKENIAKYGDKEDQEGAGGSGGPLLTVWKARGTEPDGCLGDGFPRQKEQQRQKPPKGQGREQGEHQETGSRLERQTKDYVIKGFECHLIQWWEFFQELNISTEQEIKFLHQSPESATNLLFNLGLVISTLWDSVSPCIKCKQ